MEILRITFSIAAITFPIACLVILGLLAVRTKFFDPQGVPHLAHFTTRFTLPAALFSVIAVQDIGTLINPVFFGAYGAGTFAAIGILTAWLVTRGKGLSHIGISIIGGSVSNCMIFGVPIAILLLDPGAVAAMGMVSFFQDTFILPASLAVAEMGRAGHWQSAFGAALLRSAKSPMFVALMLGVAVAALPFEPHPSILRAVELLAGGLAGVGLFMIGGLLANKHLKGTFEKIVPVLSTKLVLHPLLVGLAFWFFPLPDRDLMFAAILSASLPMITIYPAIGVSFGEGEDAAAATLAAALLSFGTVAIVMAIVLTVFP